MNDTFMHMVDQEEAEKFDSEKKGTIVSGNIVLFYLFDIGDDIDLTLIKDKRLVMITDIYLSPFFKNYHIPLPFRMKEDQEETLDPQGSCVYRKIYNFGIVSFCYRIPFQESFDDIREKVLNLRKKFDDKSNKEAKEVYGNILPAIKEANFYNLRSSYFAVQVNPLLDKMTSEEFRQKYGSKIASLLRLETQKLSSYQIDEILASTTGYYGQELIIIDSAASFIYDNEFFEAIEFIESANIEKLELQYFDRVLDQKLQYFYTQKSYKVPLVAYIPLLTEKLDLPISQLAKLKVDISVVTERLENSINVAGDIYYSKLYSMLVEKLFLKEWRESITRKLNIIKDLYTVHQDRLDTIHEGILTLVIIILIVLEIFMLVR